MIMMMKAELSQLNVLTVMPTMILKLGMEFYMQADVGIVEKQNKNNEMVK